MRTVGQGIAGEEAAAMVALGLRVDEHAFKEHFSMLLDAQVIYQNRYDIYKDRPIRSMGWRGCLMQARTCAERLWAMMLDDEWRRDDALDLINYAVHYLRQGVTSNRGWEYPDTAPTLDPGAAHPTGA
jgi:hypothetical protein